MKLLYWLVKIYITVKHHGMCFQDVNTVVAVERTIFVIRLCHSLTLALVSYSLDCTYP